VRLPEFPNRAEKRRAAAGERVAITARDGLRVEGTLWRPTGATGKRGGRRVPTIVYLHGFASGPGSTKAQVFRARLAAHHGTRAIGASFHQRTLALLTDYYDLLDISFIRYNAAHPGARRGRLPLRDHVDQERECEGVAVREL
jgi:hypothetical protein